MDAIVVAAVVLLIIIAIAVVLRPPSAVVKALSGAALLVGTATLATLGWATNSPKHGGSAPRPKVPPHRKGDPVRPCSGKYTEDELSAIANAAYAKKPWPPPKTFGEIKATRLPYREGKKLMRLQLHLGQRKLLLWEVEFLTRHGGLSKNVVYAGAAPGRHFWLVAKLFPDHHFYLYDPARFSARETDKVHLHREFFTDDIAKGLRERFGGDMLFLSDIRSGTVKMSFEAFEQQVRADQDAQARWIEIMQPRAASVKFRIPYDILKPAPPAEKPENTDEKTPKGEQTPKVARKYEYVAGELLLQAWAPVATTEARLEIVRPPEGWKGDKLPRIKYDADEYEEAFSYHGLVRRDWVFFEHDVAPAYGLDHCYDCAREVQIWKDYIEKQADAREEESDAREYTVHDLVKLASSADGRTLRRGGHGECPLELMVNKRAQIMPEHDKRECQRNGTPLNPLEPSAEATCE